MRSPLKSCRTSACGRQLLGRNRPVLKTQPPWASPLKLLTWLMLDVEVLGSVQLIELPSGELLPCFCAGNLGNVNAAYTAIRPESVHEVDSAFFT
jgi:hypothetical protein